jgi:hypothetical protein
MNEVAHTITTNMITSFYTKTYPQTVYTRDINQYFQNTYISFDEIIIENLINEIKKISSYEIENYDFEPIDDDMIALGIKLKNFPADKNKVAYSIELMNKLNEKLPDNIDIFVV